MALIAPSRRRFLQFAAGAAFAPGLAALKTQTVVGRVLAVSDLHSAYERTPCLLAAFEHEIRSHAVPHVIAVNGDIFEHGNVVAQRSDGVVDWALLAALPALAPTVVNLGNHDNDLTPDLADVVARMRGLGLHIVTTITDTRTGVGYASPTATLPFGPHRLRVVGMATNSMNTYPKASRDQLSIPPAADCARANLADSLSGADKVMVMSHAGVVADRDILPLLPEGALMVGGHDHLLFQHRQGASAYVHTGSFTSAYTVAAFRDDGSVTATSRPVSTDGPASPALAALTTRTLADQLTPDERTVLWTGHRAMSLGDTGRAIAAGMAHATGAHAGFIGHTTLGNAAPAGPVSRYLFDSIVRFDGALMTAEVTPRQFEAFMARANQDRPLPLDALTGDFLYASGLTPPSGPVRIVTTDWCATNQQKYFGTEDLVFEQAPGVTLKSVAASALAGG
ncbi:metallophosphoesterase [Brevundimonas sp.]|uniref:metallophosphoesterase n=1 Tax=Brevundimonas sp. TaxID=1871086 RepID=UPI00289E26A6|nr:metallophosphoesterase [Brevundimonas sp.]